MKICTKAKAAKLLGVSRATIYAMIERGELVPNELGYVDIDQLPPRKDYSKPGRKRVEKNEGENGEGGTGTAINKSTYTTERYIEILEKEIDFLHKQVEQLQRESKQHHQTMSHVLTWAMYIQHDVYDILPPVLLRKLKDRLIGLHELVNNLFAETDIELQMDIENAKIPYGSYAKPVFTVQRRQTADLNVESKKS